MIAVLDLWGFKRCIQIARPLPKIEMPTYEQTVLDEEVDYSKIQQHFAKFEFMLDHVDKEQDIAFYKFIGGI